MKKRRKEEKSSGKELLVKKVINDAILPKYALESDVGLDLVSAEKIIVKPMEQKTVRTGLIIQIPEGHVGLIRDRAGIVTKMNVHTVAGTFDPAYRGEVSIVLVNFSEQDVEIDKGMKIAQMIVLPIAKVKIKEAKSLDKTERGEKGFGSTGMREKMKAIQELMDAGKIQDLSKKKCSYLG